MIIGISSVTSKGQVTLPKEIREAVGIHEGDKVEITYDGKHVEVRSYGLVQEELNGSLAAYAAGKPFSEVANQAAVEAALTDKWGRKQGRE